VLLFGIYPARAADFGAPIPDYVERINIMYPPLSTNGTLCDYPDEAGNDTSLGRVMNAVDAPIALLLESSSQCSATQQTRVAARMRRQFADKLHYIIVRGTPELGDYLQVLSPDNVSDSGGQTQSSTRSLDSIGVLYITYHTGLYMQQHVSRRQGMWGGSPYFLNPNGENVYWTLITNIEVYQPPPNSGGSASGDGSDSFYWFRVLLFTLLIVSPCCRAGYLWWSGGGRIRFRRNNNGRIVGLQYIP